MIDNYLLIKPNLTCSPTPTGTGKTLVSVMVMAAMLSANPRRPVLFLVDKVLLVMQQAAYIKDQLSGRMFKRLVNGHLSPPAFVLLNYLCIPLSVSVCLLGLGEQVRLGLINR